MADVEVDNYLGVTREDFDSLKSEDYQVSSSAEMVLKEFKGMDCAVCAHHFGFQSRWDPKILLCSPQCLSAANYKMKTLPPSEHPMAKHKVNLECAKVGVSVKPACGGGRNEVSPDVPRPVLQGLGNHNQVNIQMPRVNNMDAIDQEKGYRKNDMENCNGNARNYTNSNSTRGGRGGYNNTGIRGGGRIGTGTPRTFGRNDGTSESPFGRSGDKPSWGNKAGDEIDSRIEVPEKSPQQVENDRPGKENIPSTEPTVKFLQISSKEASLNAARQPRMAKPGLGVTATPVDINTPTPPAVVAVPVQKVSPPVQKPPVATPAPVSKPPVATPAPVSKPPVVTPAPVQTAPAAPAATPPQKKIWNFKDLIYSMSLVNMADCTISFQWSPTKLTLVAVADNSKLTKFQEDLNTYCAKGEVVTRIPSKGDIVFALYQGEFYRGRVDAVRPESKEVMVTFIDFGDALGVKLSDCREPEDELMKNNPVYGVIFNISLPVECPKDLEICPELSAALDLPKLTMQIENQGEGVLREFTGKVYVDDKKTWNDILEKQIKASNLAAAKEKTPEATKPIQQPAPKPVPEVKSTVASPPASNTPKEPEKSSATGTDPPSSRPKATNPFGASRPSPVKRNVHNVQWTPNLDNGAEVHVNFMWKYHKFSVSSKADDAALDKLNNLIQEYASAAPAMQRVPAVDEIVIGPYEGAYYRGRVSAVEGEMVTVEFLDYGDQNKVKSSELKELSNEINAHPIYGVIMIMTGVPEDIPSNEALISAQPSGGQIEVTKMENGVFHGRLWVSNGSCWNDIVVDTIASQ